MNSQYGRDKFMTDYNIDGSHGTVLGAYVITQAALFPWFKAMYEAGGVPGILWQDYLCNGMCTATQYKELKFFHKKIEKCSPRTKERPGPRILASRIRVGEKPPRLPGVTRRNMWRKRCPKSNETVFLRGGIALRKDNAYEEKSYLCVFVQPF